MEKKLSQSEEWVLDFLRHSHTWLSPTHIGYAHGAQIGASLSHNSAWASPICKKLVAKGLVERNDRGHYKIKP